MIHSTRQNTLRIYGILILILSLLIGCASKKSLWGNPETGFVLQYRMAQGESWTFHSATTEMTSMEMMGQSMETETTIPLIYSIKGKGVDDQKNLLTEVTIDSMSWTTSSMQGDQEVDTKPVIGKSFGLTLSPIGKELEFKGTDEIPEIDLGQMGGKRKVKSLFRSALPDLPQDPVKIGDTWQSTEKLTEPQNNMDVTSNTETINTLEGYETIGNTECLKIKSKVTGTLDGSGNMMGNDMTFEGDIEGTSTWYFDYKKGSLIRIISDGIMEGTVAVSGQTNMTIPIVVESKVELKRVK